MREKKIQRSRERIASEAMALFGRNGYEQTTMEAIAEAADVSPRTLYRYFPSKDLIVLASFTANTAKFSEVFALRLKEMPIERALAETIFAVLAVEDEEPEHALLVRSIIGQSPVTRARLWDYLGEQQRSLTKQLAERLGVDESDPAVILTSRVTLEVLLAAADIWRASKEGASSRGTAENLMQLLRNGSVLFPDPGMDVRPKPSGPNQSARSSLSGGANQRATAKAACRKKRP